MLSVQRLLKAYDEQTIAGTASTEYKRGFLAAHRLMRFEITSVLSHLQNVFIKIASDL